MKRIDAYLASSFTRNFLFAITAFWLLYVAGSIFDELNVFMRTNASFADAASLILVRSPQSLAPIMPFTALIAAVATLTIMGRNGETTALRASGISLARIARPLVLCGLGAALLQFALQEWVIPSTYALGQEIRTVRILKRPLKTLVREQNVWFRFGSAFVHADRVRASDKSLEGVTVYELGETGINRTISARRAEWDGQEWVLQNAVSRKFNAAGGWAEDGPARIPYPVSIPPDDLSVIKVEPEHSSMETIRSRQEILARQGADVTALKVEFWKKLSFPFACLIMPLLAVPFAVRTTQRTGLWGGVALALMLGFIFMGANFAGASMGKVGSVPPWLAAWTGSLIFIPVALILMKSAERG